MEELKPLLQNGEEHISEGYNVVLMIRDMNAWKFVRHQTKIP